MRRIKSIPGPFRAGVLALIVLFVILLAATLRLVVNENRIAGVPAEGVIWFSSQGQYEAMRLADAVMRFETARAPADEVVLRYDLLDSRLRLFEEGPMVHRLEEMGFVDEIADIRARFESQRPVITSLKGYDHKAMTALHDAALTIALSMRDLANAGMLDGRERQAIVRDERRQLLFELLAYLIATLIVGVLIAFIIIRGLTNVAQAEAALAHEREVSRLHRAFTSVVSHQFRTPLSIIDSSAQRMLRRGAEMSAAEIAERVTKIRNACQRLTRLMESTLNAARLEQGEIAFKAQAHDLHHLVSTLCDNQPEEDQRRLLRAFDSLPRQAYADGPLLEQAVQNLISNALKYSPSKAVVTIRGGVEAGNVTISVEDNGVGIPANELPFITERFYRARTAEGIPGTGIGLNFVAQIMSLHNGRLTVESVEGQGSVFALLFPYRPAAASDLKRAALSS